MSGGNSWRFQQARNSKLSVMLAGFALCSTMPLSAQDGGSAELDAQHVPGRTLPGLCMAWQAGRSAGQAGIGPMREVVVLVTEAANLEQKGYEAIDCPAKFVDSKGVAQWRDQVCAAASRDNEALQDRFERNWGERAALLCGSVQQVIGEWDGSVADDQLIED